MREGGDINATSGNKEKGLSPDRTSKMDERAHEDSGKDPCADGEVVAHRSAILKLMKM